MPAEALRTPSFKQARGLLGLLDDLDETPALRGTERAGLGDDDQVADAGGVQLVVRLDLRGATQDLAVQRVLDAVFDLDGDLIFVDAVVVDVIVDAVVISSLL